MLNHTLLLLSNFLMIGIQTAEINVWVNETDWSCIKYKPVHCIFSILFVLYFLHVTQLSL